jgi:hemolysin-activating ACP:hemolysin acyltransferase
MKYTSVLIEVLDADVTFKNPVKVTSNFDATKLIGEATVYHKDGKLYADIDVKEDAMGLFPAIGFTINPKKLYQIGLCNQSNVDESIKPL